MLSYLWSDFGYKTWVLNQTDGQMGGSMLSVSALIEMTDVTSFSYNFIID
jgi:hypothetical protein